MYALTHDNAAENGTKEQVNMDIRRNDITRIKHLQIKECQLTGGGGKTRASMEVSSSVTFSSKSLLTRGSLL